MQLETEFANAAQVEAAHQPPNVRSRDSRNQGQSAAEKAKKDAARRQQLLTVKKQELERCEKDFQ